MADQAVIETNRLSCRFGTMTAIDQLDLTIYSGEIFGLLGHQGAGKTTSIRLLNGVLAPSAGTARVLGMNPLVEGAALRRRTGVLTATPALEARLTGREHLSLYAELFGMPRQAVAQRIDALLATCALSAHAAEPVSNYSRAMQQRLALARTLLHEPELLFMDEPTAGLDPVATRQVHQLITHFSRMQGRTVVLCTHNLAEAQQLCDRMAVLEHGRLVALGTPATLSRQTHQVLRLELEADEGCCATTLAQLAHHYHLYVHAETSTRISISGARQACLPDLLADLARAGIRRSCIKLQESSLAELYGALHEEP